MIPVESALLAAVAFAFGLAVGSFLNVVIHRVPMGESVVTPRSRCPGCTRPIAAWDNIPVISYLILKARCRHCGVRISLRYPLVEMATGLVFACLALRLGLHPLLPVWMVAAALLVASAMIDFDHQFIPDGLSVGGALFALLAVPVANSLAGISYPEALVEALLGAGVGSGFLWIVGFVHARISAVMGRTFPHWPDEGEGFPTPGTLDYWTWFPGLGFGDV
ncbi:MAG: prepilin peptidase, partial [bacterium]|nr:prepilin peptidase [bacterium]